MQIPIPFNEFQITDQWSEAYQHMIIDLPVIDKVTRDDLLHNAQSAIVTIRKFMSLLKNFCQSHTFHDEASEIQFFKSVKPRFHAHLIYWTTLLDISLKRPVGSLKHEKKYLNKRLKSVKDYFERHRDFYTYYRSGQNDRDVIYFTRKSGALSSFENTDIAVADPLFSTSHDNLVAGVLANDMIREYLLKALSAIKSYKYSHKVQPNSSSLKWTASKSGLVELVYSLYSGGVFNNGKAMVSEIASVFQDKFDIKLVNYYHTFNEIRLRKKNRTAFMDSLRDKLSQKMDESEEG